MAPASCKESQLAPAKKEESESWTSLRKENKRGIGGKKRALLFVARRRKGRWGRGVLKGKPKPHRLF